MDNDPLGGAHTVRHSGLHSSRAFSFLRFLSARRAGAALAAALCTVILAGSLAAPASAETRRLKLYYLHTKERSTITFKKDGKYVQSGLKKINWMLRDWRRNEPTKMDPELLDLIWEVYRESGSRDYIHVISGYRAPATNNLLRKRGRGVAKNSLHTLGRALDFFLPDVKLAKLREVGLKVGFGGVGYYPTSGSPFVHIDTGNVRHWPRMERQQLARMFPDGKTMHIPKDGRPLPGYEQAKQVWLAKRSGDAPLGVEGDEEESPNLFARLFNRNRGDDKEEATQDAEEVASQSDGENTEESSGETATAIEENTLPEILPVPTRAPRDGLNDGQQLLVASAEPEETGAQAPAPVPVTRPANEPAATGGGSVKTASFSASDLANLRASAVPSEPAERTEIVEGSDDRTLLPGPGTGDTPELTAPDGERSVTELAFAAAEPQQRRDDSEPYFGPAPSTLELALAANEKSSQATEAIRKLITASGPATVVAQEGSDPLIEPGSETGTALIPVPLRNPMKDNTLVVASITENRQPEKPAVGHWALAGDRFMSRIFTLTAPAYGKNAVSGHNPARMTTNFGNSAQQYVPGSLSQLEGGIDSLVTASTSSN